MTSYVTEMTAKLETKSVAEMVAQLENNIKAANVRMEPGRAPPDGVPDPVPGTATGPAGSPATTYPDTSVEPPFIPMKALPPCVEANPTLCNR